MKSKVNFRKIKIEYLLLTLILLFGLFLRLYQLGNSPLWVDEAISVETARNVIETGRAKLPTGSDAGAWILHYSMAFFMLFGQTEFFARFSSVLFGLLTIILAYFIGKEYSKSGGIISALFFSVFYLEVFFSRQSRYYQLFQLAFFASLYFLYKSKEKPLWLIPSIICFFITLDTHLEGLVLAPFFILHILIFNRKQWFVSILPALPLVKRFISTSSLSTGGIITNYAGKYFSYASNMIYLLILFVFGLVYSFIKKKRLTFFIIVPAIIALVGIFSLQTFAFRYAYVFIFPLLLYSSLLFAYLYDKYGKLILIPILILLIVPSNLFFPQTYVNVINPINYNYNDPSAPYTDYKVLPDSLVETLKSDTALITLFSLDAKFYLRTPDYAIPFSMNGIGEDQISINNSQGQLVDRYSGAPILNYNNPPSKPYNVLVDSFSASKLKLIQKQNLNSLIAKCSLEYSAEDLKVYSCKD